MRKFLLACGLMLAFSALSFGGLLQTQTISISITDVPSFTPLVFNQYNGPMTVDRVELIVQSSVEAEFTFSNNKNGAGFDAPKTLLAGGMAAGGAATHLVLVQFLGGNVGGAAATASPIIAVNTVLADDEFVTSQCQTAAHPQFPTSLLSSASCWAAVPSSSMLSALAISSCRAWWVATSTFSAT